MSFVVETLIPSPSRVGASHYVTNFNITLDTQDLAIGRNVAVGVRATSEGGMPGVEAMAFPHQGRIEVALNVNSRPREEFLEGIETLEGFGGGCYASPDALERRIKELSAKDGVSLYGWRTVGFWPLEAEKLAKATIGVDPQVWLKRWPLRQM